MVRGEAGKPGLTLSIRDADPWARSPRSLPDCRFRRGDAGRGGVYADPREPSTWLNHASVQYLLKIWGAPGPTLSRVGPSGAHSSKRPRHLQLNAHFLMPF